MSINPYRGDVEIVINDKPQKMRLTLGALAGLESRLGDDGLLPLIERFEAGDFQTNDLIELLYAGLQGGGWAGTRADLESAKIQGGIVKAAKLTGEMLALAFSLPE